jgi:N6-adenosine-specific RNA methylase IME4
VSVPKIQRIGLSGIAVLPDRIRALRPEAVSELSESMRERGLINPITLRPREDGIGFYMIAGRHRYEAARTLKWETIPAIVLEGIDAVEAELCEIDENLIRVDLSPAEQAAHHARRKELYQQKHPETRHGGDRKGEGSSRQVGDLNERYTKEAAKKTGESERTIQRVVKRGEAIPHVAELAHTSLDKGEELDALAKLAPDRQAQLIERAKAGEKVSAKTEPKKARREEREAELGQAQAAGNLALPDKRYGVILADPEWRFEPLSRETGMDRAADNHYSTSLLDVIKERDVPSIAADDCVLFLWATVPMLPQALEVMEAWGFDYRSHVIWFKPIAGTGYWFRNKHELLLVGVKGDVPAPAMGTQWGSLMTGEAGRHSAKPDWQYHLAEMFYPNLPKIELNARRCRPGWDSWGLDGPAVPILGATPSPALVPDPPKEMAPSPALAPPDLEDIPSFLDRRRKPALAYASAQ